MKDFNPYPPEKLSQNGLVSRRCPRPSHPCRVWPRGVGSWARGRSCPRRLLDSAALILDTAGALSSPSPRQATSVARSAFASGPPPPWSTATATARRRVAASGARTPSDGTRPAAAVRRSVLSGFAPLVVVVVAAAFREDLLGQAITAMNAIASTAAIGTHAHLRRSRGVAVDTDIGAAMGSGRNGTVNVVSTGAARAANVGSAAAARGAFSTEPVTRNASAIAPVDWNRSSGRRAIARVTASARSTGTSPRSSAKGVGSACWIAYATVSGVSPPNGFTPASAS